MDVFPTFAVIMLIGAVLLAVGSGPSIRKTIRRRIDRRAKVRERMRRTLYQRQEAHAAHLHALEQGELNRKYRRGMN